MNTGQRIICLASPLCPVVRVFAQHYTREAPFPTCGMREVWIVPKEVNCAPRSGSGWRQVEAGSGDNFAQESASRASAAQPLTIGAGQASPGLKRCCFHRLLIFPGSISVLPSRFKRISASAKRTLTRWEEGRSERGARRRGQDRAREREVKCGVDGTRPSCSAAPEKSRGFFSLPPFHFSTQGPSTPPSRICLSRCLRSPPVPCHHTRRRESVRSK